MKVYVHLAVAQHPHRWAEQFAAGRLVGLNEPDPYGYARAEHMGVTLIPPAVSGEGRLGRLVRMGVGALVGFDLVNAWRNRSSIMAADVVWTHTESQFLGVCALLALRRRGRTAPPRLLAQAVWLIDRWPHTNPLHRRLWRRLIRQADVLTFHSPLNLAEARRLFPQQRCELVRFGIRADHREPPRTPPAPGGARRIISVGNDKHRDWRSLVEAVRGHPEWQLRIVSTKADPELARGLDNVTIAGVTSSEDLFALYREADLVVIPLQHNLHVSGSTALQEAALFGVPTIATAVGGHEAYFPADAVRYVPEHDPAAIAAAIADLAADPAAAAAMAARAQAQMGDEGLSSESYVRAHVRLSRELLAAA
ncbi:glycosyltransferase [Sphingomonas sp. RHCKR7]|uniref:glycosyltransferase n=1 Tax=Sphingomonas folli TaxID=2862497 RepID=UPI001CA52440|nr:glycosyltransferase [Sphingomonas folli]MBW6528269.1 glycosyltransferase [Sphingomonas folli]